MAQAIRNKDVRKNCVDAEKVIMDLNSDDRMEALIRIPEPIGLKKPSNKILKLISGNNANFRHELKPINKVKQKLVYKNYAIY